MDRIESHAFVIGFALLLAAIALFMNSAVHREIPLPTATVRHEAH